VTRFSKAFLGPESAKDIPTWEFSVVTPLQFQLRPDGDVSQLESQLREAFEDLGLVECGLKLIRDKTRLAKSVTPSGPMDSKPVLLLNSGFGREPH
jgi:hypothetical protein